MSTSLLRVVERARREPEGRFHSLAHLIDVPALERAFHRLRGNAAVGVDGVSKAEYGQALEANLEGLHRRLKKKRYRHQPLRRVHIPKGGGRTRPIGISAVEDKIVQEAVREVLEAVYEQDFVECSYGFRPGRGAHDAIRTLDRAVYQGKVRWILVRQANWQKVGGESPLERRTNQPRFSASRASGTVRGQAKRR